MFPRESVNCSFRKDRDVSGHRTTSEVAAGLIGVGVDVEGVGRSLEGTEYK